MVFDLATELTGISGILVSPFDGDDRLAPDRLAPMIDRAIGAGTHCLTVNGNTDEFYGLAGPDADRIGTGGFTSGLINVWREKSVVNHAALEAGDYCLADHLIGEMAGFEGLRAEKHQMTGQDCGAARPPSAWPRPKTKRPACAPCCARPDC